MTLEEMLAKANGTEKQRKPHRDIEHNLQVACVRWFRMEHHELSGLLFAVPNGGRRDQVTGAKMKAEGQLAGVSDLILLLPCGGYHGLCIELKTKEHSSRQSESQKVFQDNVTRHGYQYIIVRCIEDFISQINQYLGI